MGKHVAREEDCASELVGPPKQGQLFVVCGAPGSGKTTVLRHLLAAAPPAMVFADIDDLLDDGKVLGVTITSADAAPMWPAYNAMWVRITRMIRRSGIDVTLLCPLYPSELPEADVAAWLLLDCSDSERRTRLQERHWSSQQIQEALTDAAEARELFTEVLNTDVISAKEAAELMLHWIAQQRLAVDAT